MSIGEHHGNGGRISVRDADSMYRTIREWGIIPFFTGPIPGYSIEELTPREFWFDGDELGPWDWKIPCVQSGDIAYGKFLWGGKSAFATVEWYRDLMNWRRSLPRFQPAGDQKTILDFVQENGSVEIRQIRKLLGIKKGAADALVTKLQMQTRLVTGDIRRVYRGQDLHYNGWQVSSFCSPDSLFGLETEPEPPISSIPSFFGKGFPFAEETASLFRRTPEESLERLRSHIRTLFPAVTDAQLQKLLG